MKHLIFDCDGVLVDSEIIAAEVMTDLLNRYGIPITLDFYLTECTGKTFSGLRESLSETYKQPLPDDFIEEVSHKMALHIESNLKVVSGIAELLNSLKSYQKSVVSNSSMGEVEASLNKTGIHHHFDQRLFSSELVPKPKPAPDVYLHALDELSLSPSECIVIEDSVSGAAAALEAGLTVIGFLGGKHIVAGHDDRLKSIGVNHTAQSAHELQGLIVSLS